MRQIGRRTAELHRALASSSSDSAFAPEPIAPADLQTWTDELLELTQRNFDELGRRRTHIPDGVARTTDILLARKEAAVARIRDLLPRDLEAWKIRQHGDFHLGQTLIVKDDVYIIDFEGEPERSLPSRRRKAPAARDVAGLIRSIDYAATAAVDRMTPGSAEERARLSRAVDEWRSQCIDTFVSAYRETTGESGLWPADPLTATRLRDFFVLEKAIYEIGYELANRPSWLHVPLDGTWRLLFPGEAFEP